MRGQEQLGPQGRTAWRAEGRGLSPWLLRWASRIGHHSSFSCPPGSRGSIQNPQLVGRPGTAHGLVPLPCHPGAAQDCSSLVTGRVQRMLQDPVWGGR